MYIEKGPIAFVTIIKWVGDQLMRLKGGQLTKTGATAAEAPETNWN